MSDDPLRTEQVLHQRQDAPDDTSPRPVGLTRHEAAIRRSLEWADEAAALMDYSGALAWLEAITATGHQLSDEYLDKQHLWVAAAGGATP